MWSRDFREFAELLNRHEASGRPKDLVDLSCLE